MKKIKNWRHPTQYGGLEPNEKYEETCKIDDMEKQAFFIKDNILPLMNNLRKVVDNCETVMPRNYWPMPTYEELLFSEK
jgi:glutamine synthetase